MSSDKNFRSRVDDAAAILLRRLHEIIPLSAGLMFSSSFGPTPVLGIINTGVTVFVSPWIFAPVCMGLADILWRIGSRIIHFFARSVDREIIMRRSAWTYLAFTLWLLYPIENPVLRTLHAAVFLYLFGLLQWCVLLVERLSPKRRATLILAIILASPVLAVTTLEVKFRMDEKGDFERTVVEGLSYFDHVPYVMVRARPGQDVTLNTDASIMNHKRGVTRIVTNALGYRGPLPSTDTSRIRILVLGGSLVFNGSAEDKTIASRLETRLNNLRPAGRRVVTWNGGNMAAITNQEAVAYGMDFLPFRPDMVIVINGFNDFWVPHQYERRVGYPHNFYQYDMSVSDRILEAHSQIYNHYLAASKNCGGRSLGFEWPWSEEYLRIMEKVLENYMTNTRRMADLNRDLGIPTYFYLQPLRGYSLATATHLKKPHNGRDVERLMDFYYRTTWKWFDMINGEYSGARIPIRFGELTTTGLEKDHRYFWDMCHVFDEGNDIIAERIARDIESEVEAISRGNARGAAPL